MNEWINLSGPLALRNAAEEVLACNVWTARFGLAVSPGQARELVQARQVALKSCGRLELGGGTLPALLHAFCDSPYIDQSNMVDVLSELLELFYIYKNETLDAIGDDELIAYMCDEFNGRCQGCIDLLEGWSLERLAHSIHFGEALDEDEDENQDVDTE